MMVYFGHLPINQEFSILFCIFTFLLLSFRVMNVNPLYYKLAFLSCLFMNSSYSTSMAFKFLQVLKEHSGAHSLICTAFGRKFFHRSPRTCEQIFGSR